MSHAVYVGDRPMSVTSVFIGKQQHLMIWPVLQASDGAALFLEHRFEDRVEDASVAPAEVLGTAIAGGRLRRAWWFGYDDRRNLWVYAGPVPLPDAALGNILPAMEQAVAQESHAQSLLR